MTVEKPIPFTGAMIREILADRKTATRRAFNPPPGLVEKYGLDSVLGHTRLALAAGHDLGAVQRKGRLVPVWRLPYAPGDRLWVREAWRARLRYDDLPPREIPQGASVHYVATDGDPPDAFGRYRPPMFMPRWSSRLSLDVTEVRVERVQEISDEDVTAEGITRQSVEDLWRAATRARQAEVCLEALQTGNANVPNALHFATPRMLWRAAWTAINGAASYDANGLVWAIGFRRAATEVRAA